MTIGKKPVRNDIPGYQPQPAASGEARRLVVGRDIALNGQIARCESLMVEGVVEAAQFAAFRLEVADAGLFSGSAEVQEAVIAGRFEGALRVSGRLTVRGTGVVVGRIEYGALEVEAGACVEGQISMLPPPVVADEPDQTEPASNVAPLFVGAAEGAEDSDADEDANRPRVFRRAVGY